MIGEECVEFFQGLESRGQGQGQGLDSEGKTKDFKIVLEDPQGRGLVLEDSNTDYY